MGRGNKVSLTIFEVSIDMSGYYTCIAKNELGTDTTRAGLTVNKALSPEEKAKLEELAKAEEAKAAERQRLRGQEKAGRGRTQGQNDPALKEDLGQGWFKTNSSQGGTPSCWSNSLEGHQNCRQGTNPEGQG